LYAWFVHIAYKTLFYYTKATLIRCEHRNNVRTTIVVGRHHTGALNN